VFRGVSRRWFGGVNGAVRFDGVGECVFRFLNAFTRNGADDEEWKLFLFCKCGELFQLVRIGDVSFCSDENCGLGGESRVEGFEFGGDDVVVVDGVGAAGGI